jgi:hypothetical protein
MDKLTKYQQIIQQLLQEYAAYSSQDQDVETQLISDTQNHHYQLVHVGWKNQRRVYGCILHLDIKEGTTQRYRKRNRRRFSKIRYSQTRYSYRFSFPI